MVQEVAFEQEKVLKSPWGGGKSPFGVSREKFTMWKLPYKLNPK